MEANKGHENMLPDSSSDDDWVGEIHSQCLVDTIEKVDPAPDIDHQGVRLALGFGKYLFSADDEVNNLFWPGCGAVHKTYKPSSCMARHQRFV